MPFRLGDFIDSERVQEEVLNIAEKDFGISKECLTSPMAYDKYMRQLDGKGPITKTSVVTGQQVNCYPASFKIYFDSWDYFTVNAGCTGPKTYDIQRPQQ